MKRILKKLLCVSISIMFILGFIVPILSNASSQTDNAKKTTLNTVSEIEKYVDESKYLGIKDKLIDLKKANPNWKFTLYYTGIDWDTAVYNEAEGLHSRSLVQDKNGEWLCSNCGTRVYDKGGWMCASKKAVAYLMDTRNYLNESYIFQFEELSYNPENYTLSGIERILSGTFMYETSIRDYYKNPNFENITFAQAIMNAASISGVSPYHLASRMRQELGINGSNSIYGTYTGYEGYYNFYNICAYSGENPIENGLKYASNATAGKYLLPWNDPVKAINGGAIWIAANYIAAGQDTLYFEKFDVVSNGTLFYTHQYMQNIFAAKNEGNTTYKAYRNLGILDSNFNFIIPLYENMPKELSKEPVGEVEINEKVKILGDNVILRQSPTTSGVILSVLAKNTEVTRLLKNVATADGYSWDKVKLSNGTIGYMASKYLGVVEEEQPKINNNTSTESKETQTEQKQEINNIQTDEKVYVNANNVYVRSNPSTSSSKIGILAKNTQVIRLEKNVANANGYSWDKIKLSSGTIGYMASKYLSTQITTNSAVVEEKAYVNANNVYVRRNPGTASGRIATLAKNTSVTRLEKNVAEVNGYNWDKVKLSNGSIGYMASKYLSSGTTSTSNTAISSEKVKVNSRNVIIRRSPTTNSTIIGVLSKGATITRLEKHVKYANGYYWDKVQLSNGTIGYMASKYLS